MHRRTRRIVKVIAAIIAAVLTFTPVLVATVAPVFLASLLAGAVASAQTGDEDDAGGTETREGDDRACKDTVVEADAETLAAFQGNQDAVLAATILLGKDPDVDLQGLTLVTSETVCKNRMRLARPNAMLRDLHTDSGTIVIVCWMKGGCAEDVEHVMALIQQCVVPLPRNPADRPPADDGASPSP